LVVQGPIVSLFSNPNVWCSGTRLCWAPQPKGLGLFSPGQRPGKSATQKGWALKGAAPLNGSQRLGVAPSGRGGMGVCGFLGLCPRL